MTQFLIPLLVPIAFPTAVNPEDQTFENWKESHFENYQFECLETGSTPEYTRFAGENYLNQIGN